jgi:hypothetical protein
MQKRQSVLTAQTIASQREQLLSHIGGSTSCRCETMKWYSHATKCSKKHEKNSLLSYASCRSVSQSRQWELRLVRLARAICLDGLRSSGNPKPEWPRDSRQARWYREVTGPFYPLCTMAPAGHPGHGPCCCQCLPCCGL